MQIQNVKRSTSATINTGEKIKVQFQIIGAVSPFQFPFSNESLSERLIQFIKKEG